MQRDPNGKMSCTFIPPLKLRLFVPLFIVGMFISALIARYSIYFAVLSHGEVLYAIGPDRSLPPGSSTS